MAYAVLTICTVFILVRSNISVLCVCIYICYSSSVSFCCTVVDVYLGCQLEQHMALPLSITSPFNLYMRLPLLIQQVSRSSVYYVFARPYIILYAE